MGRKEKGGSKEAKDTKGVKGTREEGRWAALSKGEGVAQGGFP